MGYLHYRKHVWCVNPQWILCVKESLCQTSSYVVHCVKYRVLYQELNFSYGRLQGACTSWGGLIESHCKLGCNLSHFAVKVLGDRCGSILIKGNCVILHTHLGNLEGAVCMGI